MKRNNFFKFVIILFVIFPAQQLKSEVIIMSLCDDQQDEFIKNEYILNLNELIMTRNYIYKEKTYQKYRITDLSVKKKKFLCKKYLRGKWKDINS